MHLKLVPSIRSNLLYANCVEADPLLVLVGSFALKRLLGNVVGMQSYSDFADYWFLQSPAARRVICKSGISGAVLSFFSAQFAYAFMRKRSLSISASTMVSQRIAENLSEIKLAFIDKYPVQLAEILLIMNSGIALDGDCN